MSFLGTEFLCENRSKQVFAFQFTVAQTDFYQSCFVSVNISELVDVKYVFNSYPQQIYIFFKTLLMKKIIVIAPFTRSFSFYFQFYRV